MIFVRRVRPYGPYILEHTIPSGKCSHIIRPRHRTMVPYRERTIPYTAVFPYHTVNTYHTTYIRCFLHIYTIPPTYPIFHTIIPSVVYALFAPHFYQTWSTLEDDRLSCSAVARPEGCRNRCAGLQQSKGKAGLGKLLVIELFDIPSVGNQLG